MDQLKLNCCGLGGHADCGPVGLAQSSPLGSFVGADGIAEPGESVVDEACLQNHRVEYVYRADDGSASHQTSLSFTRYYPLLL